MLGRELNERITRVGPGTPGGQLLRRYWQPVGIASQLTSEQPKQRMTVLGEDLVLYRDHAGDHGLVAEHCSHRGASLFYGFVEENGIRCPYHGWLYDRQGRCLEQPFEPRGNVLCQRIRHPAYPVQKLAGLLFAYMGPEPVPVLPRWDVLVRRDGYRKLVTGEIRCNWVQTQENTVDPTHFSFLHGHMGSENGLPDVTGYTRPFVEYGFQPFEWGLLTSWHWGADDGRFGEEVAGGNPLLFPNALSHAARSSQWINWRVPIDDTTTRVFSVEFRRSDDGRPVDQPDDPPVTQVPPSGDAQQGYDLESIIAQDIMAWETQGPIADRTREHLGAADKGIVMFRQMLLEQIAIVEAGGDPIGVIRDPEKNRVIELPGLYVPGDPSKARLSGEPVAAAKPMSTVFDRRHNVFQVPPESRVPKPSWPQRAPTGT